jgi:acyl-CoA synthetase (AMP-forming)/AMP-acid ligase II
MMEGLPTGGNAGTLSDALRETAARFSDRGITVFDSRGRSSSRRSYVNLLHAAEWFARLWTSAGVGPSDVVLIARPTGWDFLESWLGAVFCGAIPLAVAPTRGLGTARGDIERIESIAARFLARRVLIGESLRIQLQAPAHPHLSAVAITPQLLARTPPAHANGFKPQLSDCVLLQLTSGTTGRSRAVALPHRSVIENVRALDEAIASASDQVPDGIVSWLPLYHDMGLIGALILAMVTGRDLTLLPPAAFLARPVVWLDQIARYERTLTFAPNFAFDLCCERLAETSPHAELKRWQAAVCGAEMISGYTMQHFATAFTPWGFDARSLRPGYGLAEATLGVTLDRRCRGVRTRSSSNRAQESVCVGEPLRETELSIRAPDGSVRPDGEIGEICVRGPGVVERYFGDDEETPAALHNGWLHTGDLGFLHERELYMTGRIKDVLIIRGEKFMPQELESVAEGLESGVVRTAAFSLPWREDGEQAVLAVETEERDRTVLRSFEREIRARIGARLALPLADLVFVRRGHIPRTTSGKIQRAAARDLYQQQRLKSILSGE